MPSNKGKHRDNNREKIKPHKVANHKKRERIQKKEPTANVSANTRKPEVKKYIQIHTPPSDDYKHWSKPKSRRRHRSSLITVGQTLLYKQSGSRCAKSSSDKRTRTTIVVDEEIRRSEGSNL